MDMSLNFYAIEYGLGQATVTCLPRSSSSVSCC